MLVEKDPVVIVSIARTPIGGFLGGLKDYTVTQLGAHVLQSVISHSKLELHHSAIQEVIMGCVLPAGVGQAPGRQAVIRAGLSQSVHALTINKVCGSGMKAVMLAHDLLLLDENKDKMIIAGGMESMSNAPYLLHKARTGYRLGHGELQDHLFLDGLQDAYHSAPNLMGVFAEKTAKHYGFSREAQDEFALTSLVRAQQAMQKKYFQHEISPLGENEEDELPKRAKPEKISLLKPAFSSDGTVTAANSSGISDGAAAMLCMRLSTALKYQLKPFVKIVAHSTHSQAPEWFTTAPVGAIQKLYQKTSWNDKDVDLYEINEAFAAVTLAVENELKLSHEKVNIHGGACALGHPIGASGARIMVTLIAALETHELKRGIASLCIGGGEATAIALERI